MTNTRCGHPACAAVAESYDARGRRIAELEQLLSAGPEVLLRAAHRRIGDAVEALLDGPAPPAPAVAAAMRRVQAIAQLELVRVLVAVGAGVEDAFSTT